MQDQATQGREHLALLLFALDPQVGEAIFLLNSLPSSLTVHAL